jgi:hypothetical protein
MLDRFRAERPVFCRRGYGTALSEGTRINREGIAVTGSDNKEIGIALRVAYGKEKKHRNISLPDAEHFRLSRSGETVRLSLSSHAVIRNMQADAAAFEGWLLALKAWIRIEKAVLHWDTPEDTNDGHYQRFLYRVSRFNDLFSNWFAVAPESLTHLDESKIKGLVVFNAAKSPMDIPDDKSKELTLEKYLAESGWLATTFALNPDLVGRQFPVGLFQKTVSRDTKIFTGGKSAIDLVGIEDQPRRLWVFELKADGNQSMGIVSELFFYVSFMRDVIDLKFSPEGSSPRFEGRLHHSDLEGIKEIRGCLLAPMLHPLLDDNLLVSELNMACWPKGINVEFCSEKLPDVLVTQFTA